MLRGQLARPGAVGGAWAVEGTPGWEIADAVEPVPGDWLIRKYRPDAFFATPLDSMMRWNGIRTLVVVGVGAEVGVLPTLMTASNLGYFTVRGFRRPAARGPGAHGGCDAPTSPTGRW